MTEAGMEGGGGEGLTYRVLRALVEHDVILVSLMFLGIQ